MFDRIKRKATRVVKRAMGDAVDDAVEKETTKVTNKYKQQAEEEMQKANVAAYKGMKVSKKVTGTLITNFDAFKKSWEKKANDPVQSIFHFCMAAYNYSKDPEIGEPMTTLLLSKKHNQADKFSPSGFTLGKTNKYLMEHMRENINIAKSYLGGNYKQDYKFDEKKLSMAVVTAETDEKYGAVVIQSGGKDYPTPIKIAKNKEGQWKIIEFSSLATGCRVSASEEDDF